MHSAKWRPSPPLFLNFFFLLIFDFHLPLFEKPARTNWPCGHFAKRTGTHWTGRAAAEWTGLSLTHFQANNELVIASIWITWVSNLSIQHSLQWINNTRPICGYNVGRIIWEEAGSILSMPALKGLMWGYQLLDQWIGGEHLLNRRRKSFKQEQKTRPSKLEF